MTFNSNTVVDPVAKYGGRRCRGWPLLAKHFGVEVRATAVVDRCGVGDEKQPCGFDVVDCAKRRRLGGAALARDALPGRGEEVREAICSEVRLLIVGSKQEVVGSSR